MPPFDVTFDCKALSVRIKNFPENLRPNVTAEMMEVGRGMEDLARMIVAFRTGYLQSTIYSRVHDMSIELGATADYALYVELGTYKMAARPYIRPAFDAYSSQIFDAISHGVMKALQV